MLPLPLVMTATNFKIDLADGGDDAAIRRLLATNAVPGRVTVTFEREPNYFLGCGTMGRCQVLVARGAQEEIIGVAVRAARPMFVNGRAIEMGYLGQLRVDERFRGRWLVARGFQFLRQLHEAQPVPAYLISIIEENREALGVLIERRRAGFPVCRELGKLYTLALTVRRGSPERSSNGETTRACCDDLPGIVAFLRRHGAARQFYPVYDEDDFHGAATRGFQVEDFFIARRAGEIVGIVGLWDQASYKQTIVRGYAGWLRRARPFYNLGARLLAHPPLPPPGEKIAYAYASFICVADDDPTVFRALLQHVYQLAAARGYAYLTIGLSERDPLLKVARQYPHIAYPSRVFIAGWAETFEEFYEQLDDRVPYVEIAAL